MGYPQERELRTAHDHAIANDWEAIGLEICDYLTRQNIQWTSIDPVAVACKLHYLEDPKAPFCEFLVFIGVKDATCTYIQAKTAADFIKADILSRGFSVEVAFRFSEFTHSTTFIDLEDMREHASPSNDMRKRFTPALGWAISPDGRPTRMGTGGLFVQSKLPKTAGIYLLTAAHVVCDSKEAADECICPVNFPADVARKVVEDQIKTSLLDLSRPLDSMEQSLAQIKDRLELEEEERERKRAALIRRMTAFQVPKEDLESIRRFNRSLPKHGNRVGSVAKVAWRLDQGSTTKDSKALDYLEDWALIKLDDKIADVVKDTGNQIYIGSQTTLDPLFPPAGNQMITGRLCSVTGAVPQNEIKDRPHNLLEKNEQLYVFKNGATSQTTCGHVNGLVSYLHEDGKWYKAIAVIAPPNSRTTFSKAGDSGASVIDRAGRFLGILIGGSGHPTQRNEDDITYVTPWWRMKPELERFLSDASFVWEWKDGIADAPASDSSDSE